MPRLPKAFYLRYQNIFILAYKPFSRDTMVFVKWRSTCRLGPYYSTAAPQKPVRKPYFSQNISWVTISPTEKIIFPQLTNSPWVPSLRTASCIDMAYGSLGYISCGALMSGIFCLS